MTKRTSTPALEYLLRVRRKNYILAVKKIKMILGVGMILSLFMGILIGYLLGQI